MAESASAADGVANSTIVQEPRHKHQSVASSRAFLAFASGFWRQGYLTRPWGWTAIIAALLLTNLAIAVGLNVWNRWFFDALERRDASILLPAVLVFIGLIVTGALAAGLMAGARLTLQVEWREWITNRLGGRWLTDQHYYRIAISSGISSPEHRLAEDVRLASEPVVDFTVGLVNAVCAAVAFIGILFIVGGSLPLHVFGADLSIPGYIAIAAVVYAVAMSYISFRVGYPLIGRVAEKNENEAALRFALTRIRENAESIALVRGDADERGRLARHFKSLRRAWGRVIAQQARLVMIQNGNIFFAPVLPLLLAAPKYFSGELTLGAMVQLASAFTAVLGALNWFVDNSVRLAEWSASATRVEELRDAIDMSQSDLEAADPTRIVFSESPDDSVHLEGLAIAQRDGRIVIEEASLTMKPGERVLLGGESGSGKSTLIRAIAGLWPWGSGEVKFPSNATIAFVPQRPYIPDGRFREVLCYPDAIDRYSDDEIGNALSLAGLEHFSARLDESHEWSATLSGGERQRIAFARLLLQRPNIIIMDEATAALDVDTEARVLGRLFEALPKSIIVSVGHREGLVDLHPRHVMLKTMSGGGRLVNARVLAGRRDYAWLLDTIERLGKAQPP
jgi:putative ATP-binding cassette transporter